MILNNLSKNCLEILNGQKNRHTVLYNIIDRADIKLWSQNSLAGTKRPETIYAECLDWSEMILNYSYGLCQDFFNMRIYYKPIVFSFIFEMTLNYSWLFPLYKIKVGLNHNWHFSSFMFRLLLN